MRKGESGFGSSWWTWTTVTPLPRASASRAAISASPNRNGTADATSIFALLLAFALLTRYRFVWAAVAPAVATLLKQFALAALPRCAGNALGLDRLTMLFCDAAEIDEVVAFVPEDL